MACIQLKEIEVQSPNPALYETPFVFRIAVDVLDDLNSRDMEVRFVWVGSAESSYYDQKLEEIVIGPLRMGTNEFIAHVPAPQWGLIPAWDIVGVTLLIVSLYYTEKEFIRVAYLVNIAYVSDVVSQKGPCFPCIPAILC